MGRLAYPTTMIGRGELRRIRRPYTTYITTKRNEDHNVTDKKRTRSDEDQDIRTAAFQTELNDQQRPGAVTPDVALQWRAKLEEATQAATENIRKEYETRFAETRQQSDAALQQSEELRSVLASVTRDHQEEKHEWEAHSRNSRQRFDDLYAEYERSVDLCQRGNLALAESRKSIETLEHHIMVLHEHRTDVLNDMDVLQQKTELEIDNFLSEKLMPDKSLQERAAQCEQRIWTLTNDLLQQVATHEIKDVTAEYCRRIETLRVEYRQMRLDMENWERAYQSRLTEVRHQHAMLQASSEASSAVLQLRIKSLEESSHLGDRSSAYLQTIDALKTQHSTELEQVTVALEDEKAIIVGQWQAYVDELHAQLEAASRPPPDSSQDDPNSTEGQLTSEGIVPTYCSPANNYSRPPSKRHDSHRQNVQESPARRPDSTTPEISHKRTLAEKKCSELEARLVAKDLKCQELAEHIHRLLEEKVFWEDRYKNLEQQMTEKDTLVLDRGTTYNAQVDRRIMELQEENVLLAEEKALLVEEKAVIVDERREDAHRHSEAYEMLRLELAATAQALAAAAQALAVVTQEKYSLQQHLNHLEENIWRRLLKLLPMSRQLRRYVVT